jgi:selenide, water dikinase
MIHSPSVRLTAYSHGAGCGCKIAPKILDEILKGNISMPDDQRLLVGNNSRDDAAVYDLGNGNALIATTDFFMPIVDDPYEFGRIASANAISDVYAMGGKPILAIAILGWPIQLLPPEIAQQVIEGSRSICKEAGISLAGGHSIDSPEPIFGLAVNGIIDIKNIKKNNTAKPGDALFLTKKLGVGILTTAEKKGLLDGMEKSLATRQMEQLNKIGEALGAMDAVTAMTDVTGFGLLGHLTEICEGSEVSAELYFDKVPLISPALKKYIDQQCIPGGTGRNWDSYGSKITFAAEVDREYAKAILSDPQTSGGLLICSSNREAENIQRLLREYGWHDQIIGRVTDQAPPLISIKKTDPQQEGSAL